MCHCHSSAIKTFVFTLLCYTIHTRGTPIRLLSEQSHIYIWYFRIYMVLHGGQGCL